MLLVINCYLVLLFTYHVFCFIVMCDIELEVYVYLVCAFHIPYVPCRHYSVVLPWCCFGANLLRTRFT